MLAKSTVAILITLSGSVAAIIDTTPGHAQVQAECLVTSTISGRWSRAELNCGEPEGTRPRVAVVGADDLRTCPLLVGDRVSVSFGNDDQTGQPTVSGVTARGDGGPSSGDWCGRAFPPGRYTGPCLLKEDPPRHLRSDTLGARWMRRRVGTSLRDIDDNRRSIGPGGCRPAELQPGVHRIYVEESIRQGMMRPSPTWAMDRAVFASETTETNIYEGGIYIDGGLAPVDSVTDLSPLVRGWSGGTPSNAVAETPAVALPGEAELEAPAPYGRRVVVVTGEDWQTPALEASWVNHSDNPGPGGSHLGSRNPAGYFKDSDGVVHLRGVVNKVGPSSHVFTLPEGYRPLRVEVHGSLVYQDGFWDPETVRITPNGSVSATGGSRGPVSLDGISFRIF